jgi:hypothetical protein
MKLAKVLTRRIRYGGKNVDVLGDVNAAVAANVGESGTVTHVSSRQHVVHRSGSAGADADGTTSEGGADDRAGDRAD